MAPVIFRPDSCHGCLARFWPLRLPVVCSVSTQDDQQADDQKISVQAQWIWAGEDQKNDFKDIDSAYCRIEVDCSQHECKQPKATADTPGFCPGPGKYGAPGYSFQEDPSVTYEVPWSDPSSAKSMAVLYDEKQLGKVGCSDGYAMAQPQVESKCVVAADGEKAWQFEGCCADFLWFIPATNYAVAAMAFVLMSYMFIAFHIICDDFFVPALNVMCETVGLSDDVSTAVHHDSHCVLASSTCSLRTFFFVSCCRLLVPRSWRPVHHPQSYLRLWLEC